MKSSESITNSTKRKTSSRRRLKKSRRTNSTCVDTNIESTDSNINNPTRPEKIAATASEMKITPKKNNNVETVNTKANIQHTKISKQRLSNNKLSNHNTHQSSHRKKVKSGDKIAENSKNFEVDFGEIQNNFIDKPMEETETIRKWFANLPSGAARSCASAICDHKFLREFLELLGRSDVIIPNSHRSDEIGDSIMNTIVSGK